MEKGLLQMIYDVLLAATDRRWKGKENNVCITAKTYIFHTKKVSEGRKGNHTDKNKAELRRVACKDKRKDPSPKWVSWCAQHLTFASHRFYMETHQIDLSSWDFRLESSPESGWYYLIFRCHCGRMRRGFVNTTYLPVALFSPLSEQGEHVVQSCSSESLYISFFELSGKGKRRPEFGWLTLTCRCLRKRFLRLY